METLHTPAQLSVKGLTVGLKGMTRGDGVSGGRAHGAELAARRLACRSKGTERVGSQGSDQGVV